MTDLFHHSFEILSSAGGGAIVSQGCQWWRDRGRAKQQEKRDVVLDRTELEKIAVSLIGDLRQEVERLKSEVSTEQIERERLEQDCQDRHAESMSHINELKAENAGQAKEMVRLKRCNTVLQRKLGEYIGVKRVVEAVAEADREGKA